jgi:hypothetical protein
MFKHTDHTLLKGRSVSHELEGSGCSFGWKISRELENNLKMDLGEIGCEGMK